VLRLNVSTEAVPTATEGASALFVAAVAYAERGWRVFPVAGKVPRTTHGLKDATTDPEQVREWWQRWPDAGIAIATGDASGVLVLDVDGETGADSLNELERRHGQLPETVRAETGGGGVHFYFQHAEGARNSAGQLGDGLDIRAEGGYVVAPPSPHPSGRRYEWDVPPDEAELAESPQWLFASMARRNGARPRNEWRELVAKGVAQGKRNESTAALAGHLLARNVDPFVALELLVSWDERRNRPPLGRQEVTRTVGSIAAKEARKWTA
jgi:bifunctional DNA primase/polymerase-like protein/primase-like protein